MIRTKQEIFAVYHLCCSVFFEEIQCLCGGVKVFLQEVQKPLGILKLVTKRNINIPFLWLESLFEKYPIGSQQCEQCGRVFRSKRWENTSEDTYEDKSKDTNEDKSKDTSEDTSEDTYEDKFKDPSEDISKDTSEDTSEDTFDDTSEDTSEDTFDDTSEDTSEDTFDDTSKDTSEHS